MGAITMDALLLPFAVICSVGLAGIGLGFLALFHSKSAVRALEGRARARQSALEAALESTNASVNELVTEVRDLQEHAPAPAAALAPRSGLNLSKRSQALRMYRRGDNASQIAAALDAPLQEVDLLLKVHQIVLSNLVVAAKPAAAASRRVPE